MQVHGNGLYEGMQEYDDLSRALRGDFLLENPDEKVDLTGNANVSIQNQVADETNALVQWYFDYESDSLGKVLTDCENQHCNSETNIHKRKFDVFTPDISDTINTSNEEGCSNKVFECNASILDLQMELNDLVAKSQKEQCPTIKSAESLITEQRIQVIDLVERYGNKWKEFAIILHCKKGDMLRAIICGLIKSLKAQEGLPFDKISGRYSKLRALVRGKSRRYCRFL
jgi:hypothetical protein